MSNPKEPSTVLELEGDRADALLAACVHGLPFTALEAFASQLELPTADIEGLLGIPQRTFARRRKTLLLSPQESDRLYRLARTVSMAAEVLGSQAKARQWLCSPNRGLAGEGPLHLPDSDTGVGHGAEVLLRPATGLCRCNQSEHPPDTYGLVGEGGVTLEKKR